MTHMNTAKSILKATIAIVLSASAIAAESSDKTEKDMITARNVLKVDGIENARVVEILDSKNPFIFTYCRKGSTSLWRYEVSGSEAPDVREIGARVNKYQVMAGESEACAVGK